ncbi:MAG TPA: hypothetical protein VFB60_09540 [Ktedonobacteraceae bacterium]|nr:hypothetical protein [Ktedonobacteraceae bacterium]
MGISDTTSLLETSQHSEDYGASREKINDALKNFDALPSKRKITRFVFKYSWIPLLISYPLYFMMAALFYTRLCQMHGPKPPNCVVKVMAISLFLQKFNDMIMGHDNLATGSAEIVFLVIGAIFLLSFFKIWREYVPKTLRDLINNNRITAVRKSRDSDIWIIDKTKVTNRYLEFLDKYHNALSKTKNYIPCAILSFYAIVYIVILGCIACSTPIVFEKLHISLSPKNPNVFDLNLFPLVFFAIIEIILFYSFGITSSVIYISGKYLRELLQDFHIQSDLTHLDRCGGLKILGNFCLRLAVPLLAILLFFLVYDLNVWTKFSSFSPIDGRIGILYISNFLGILFLWGLALYLLIWAAVIPLWKIHVRMIDADEISQQKQSTEINRLEKRLQDLIDKDQLEQAKVVKEKLELAKTLNTWYPTWPFSLIKASALSLITLVISSSLTTIISSVVPWLLHILSPRK